MATFSLIITFSLSFFFIVGMLIPQFFKEKEQIQLFAIGVSLVIMVYLVLFDLIPEILEIFPLSNLINLDIALLSIFVGILLLKLLDFFIPEHIHNHHEGENMEAHNRHLFHIGFITSIALIIHNILEGISIYLTSLNSITSGILMVISVGLHNLPLGMEIAVSMNPDKKKNKSQKIITFLLVISSVMGAFILFIFNKDLNRLVEGVLLSFTTGMLIYIILFELLKEVVSNQNQKMVKLGLLAGIIISLILFAL